jgi:NitT/TauT family transport system ATP-binding protein
MTLGQPKDQSTVDGVDCRPAAADPAGVEMRHVDKSYGLGLGAREVVKDCSLRIEPGKFTVMIGPSGAGKSTIIRLIAGFERPTRGEIRSGGKRVEGPGRDRQVMFQETSLFPWMTTSENIVYGPKARAEYTAAAKEAGDRLTSKMGLEGFRNRFPSQLSGGMQRRAELARAMINDPVVMILDEPFRGLDSMTKRLMLEYYAGLSEESRRTNFFVTTDVDEALVLADRILVMTHIPTRVRAILEVDLPRPRRLAALVDDERANDLKADLLALLYDEAGKSFTADGNAAGFVDAYRHRAARPTADPSAASRR